MANHNIYVRRHRSENHIELSNDEITWDDNPKDFETNISDGDTVTIQLASDSKLHSLVAIKNYRDENAHFIQGLNRYYKLYSRDKRTIKFKCSQGGAHGELHDSYYIGFRVPGDDKVYWEDPKLKMSGRQG